MTQKSNKIEADELNMLLSAAEHGMAGQLLRAGMEDLAPSPVFAQELETRLSADAAPPAKPAQAKRARPVVVTGILGRLKAPPGDKGTRAGRIRPLAMSALGLAAMILLFVGMASMINRRQQLNLNGQTPVSNVVLTDTARLAKDFTLLHTLPVDFPKSGSLNTSEVSIATPCVPGVDSPGCDPQECLFPGIPFPPGCHDSPSNPGTPQKPPGRPALQDAPQEVSPRVDDPELKKTYGLKVTGATEAWTTFGGSKNFIVASYWKCLFINVDRINN